MKWQACGAIVCTTPKEAKQEIDDKVKIGHWMDDANALIDYYISVTK